MYQRPTVVFYIKLFTKPGPDASSQTETGIVRGSSCLGHQYLPGDGDINTWVHLLGRTCGWAEVSFRNLEISPAAASLRQGLMVLGV